MKTKYGLFVLSSLFLTNVLWAQTEEFRFKLYLESLANGKKDTLELGVGPNGYGWGGNAWNGWHDCLYDPELCPVYEDPFFDTVDHIGAFVVPGTDGYRRHHDTLRVRCPYYAKKRIGVLQNDMVVVFPASAQPVKVSWDRKLLQSPIVETPVLTTFEAGLRYDVIAANKWTPIKIIMSDAQECQVGYSRSGDMYDSLAMCAYIKDSLGGEHPYLYFFVLTGEDRHAWNEDKKKGTPIVIYPNPFKDGFMIKGVENLQRWEVYSASGKFIASGTDTKIDSRDWTSGVYLLFWKDKTENTGFLKVIKK